MSCYYYMLLLVSVEQTILGCEGDDLASELVLFRYQMDILRAGAKVAQAH